MSCSHRKRPTKLADLCWSKRPLSGVKRTFNFDFCPDTTIPEAGPTIRLGVNRWALMDGDTDFDTTAPKGKGPRRSYSTTDTAGCSCDQIIEAQGLGGGHTKFGCSIGVMDNWVELVTP